MSRDPNKKTPRLLKASEIKSTSLAFLLRCYSLNSLELLQLEFQNIEIDVQQLLVLIYPLIQLLAISE